MSLCTVCPWRTLEEEWNFHETEKTTRVSFKFYKIINVIHFLVGCCFFKKSFKKMEDIEVLLFVGY